MAKGEEFFEHLRSLDGAVEAIGFDVIEKILEAEGIFERAGALFGVRGHKPAEHADDNGRKNSAHDEWQRGHAQGGSERRSTPEGKKADDDGRLRRRRSEHCRGDGGKSPAPRGIEDAAFYVGKVFVEAILQAVHGNGFPEVPAEKKPLRRDLFVRLEGEPLGAIFLEDETVVLVVKQTEHAIFLVLFDDHVAADGEIDDVAVMSRMSTESSTSEPTSPGVS